MGNTFAILNEPSCTVRNIVKIDLNIYSRSNSVLQLI